MLRRLTIRVFEISTNEICNGGEIWEFFREIERENGYKYMCVRVMNVVNRASVTVTSTKVECVAPNSGKLDNSVDAVESSKEAVESSKEVYLSRYQVVTRQSLIVGINVNAGLEYLATASGHGG